MKHNFLRRLGAAALALSLVMSLLVAPAWADDPEFTSIELEENPFSVTLNPNELYNASSGSRALIVYGVAADGTKTPLGSRQYKLAEGEDGNDIIIVNGNNSITASGTNTGTATVWVTLGSWTNSVDDFVPAAGADGNEIRTSFQVIIPAPAKPNNPKITVSSSGGYEINRTDTSVEILVAVGGKIDLTSSVEGDVNVAFMNTSWGDTTGGGVIGLHSYGNYARNAEVTAVKQGRAVITASLVSGTTELAKFTVTIHVGDYEIKVTDEKQGTISDNKRNIHETINLKQGESVKLRGVVDLVVDTDENLDWDSTDKDLVKIKQDGFGWVTITADETAFGQTTITVSGDGVSTDFYINVPEPGAVDVQSVTLNQSTLDLNLSEMYTLVATVLPTNATNRDVAWTSSASDIVRVEDNGRITALKVGEATIRATSKYNTTKWAECKVTVKPRLTSLVIQGKNSSDQLTLNSSMSKPGGTQKIEAKAYPENAAFTNVAWSSDNTGVVTVSKDTTYASGLFANLTSVGPGEAHITIKCGDVEDTARVTIPGLVINSGVHTMVNGRLSLKEGDTDQLTYKGYGQAATLTNAVPDWSSSDGSVVDVDRINGSITARKAGTATITLSLGSGSNNYEAKCTITVGEDTSGIINAGSVNSGQPYSFDKLASQLQSVCSAKVGGTLVYINNLSVASTEQGILHDEHVSTDDTGAGVGIQDRYYRSANTSQGQRPLSDLSFVPRNTFNGTAEISFTGWNNENKPFNGVVRITVNGTGDVMYATDSGSPVTFLGSDFNLYHPNLKSVSFTPPQESVGTLYYNYVSASQPGTKVTSGTQYSRTGTPSIDKVTFVPAANYQGTAKIAYKGTDTSGRTVTGAVTITVTKGNGTGGDPADISYTVQENSWITLRASDFNDKSRIVLGETLSYVRFTPPPSDQGTLFYNYRGFSSFDSMVSSTTSYYYSGNPSLSGVSFVPTTTTPAQVDIPYTGYTTRGNTFEGIIHIGLNNLPQEEKPLHYTVFTGRTVYLNASDFNTVCYSATGRNLSSIQFTQVPGVSQGNLRYTYGSSSTSYNVTAGTRFYRTGTNTYAYLISNVYFQASSSTGTVTIPFTGYADNGATFTDEVVITVTPPTASDIVYSGTTASSIRLSASRVMSALSGVMDRNLSYITFTNIPSSTAGKLTLSYNGFNTGSSVYTGTRYYASGSPSIDQITFVPRGRYSGQVSVGYTAVSTSGQSVDGRIIFNISSTGYSSHFIDVGNYTWAAPSVDYLYENGVVNGIGGSRFGPGMNIQRGDFVLMLCRAFNFTGSNGYSFSDVPANSYFSQAIATAKQMGIVNGSGGRFMPYSPITRQDAMVIIYNALRAAGWNVGGAPDSVLSPFSDNRSVSGYARSAVSALVQMGAVNGNNGRLYPHSSITRAEAAVILHFVMTM